MAHLKKHIFICENQREANHPKGCCADRGGKELKNALKLEITRRNLKKEYRINSAGCLDVCEHGAAMVIYPQNIWYGAVKLGDVSQIVEQSIVGDKIIQKLIIPSKKKDSANSD